MSGELSEKYRVPRKIAKSWLQSNYLLPLLDGLDEVPTALQPDCVTAINAFIDKSNPPGIAVCCRLNEYRWLPERLKLNGAICIEPLSKDEVAEYFTKGGAELAGLRKAMNTDPVLQELTQTPLMLSVMSLAYQGIGDGELATRTGDSAEERQKQIFRLYVDRMFERKGTTSLAFPKEKTIGWLSWLARKMKEHSQSDFLVEGLQPSWLSTRAKRVAYGTIVALSLGLIYGLIYGLIGKPVGGLTFVLTFPLSISVGVGLGCWSESPLRNGVISGLVGGLIVVLSFVPSVLSFVRRGLTLWPREMLTMLTGVLTLVLIFVLTAGAIAGAIGGLGVGSLNHITSVESMSWKWSQFWKKAIPASIVGLICGLSLALIAWLIILTVGYKLRIKIRYLGNTFLFFGLPFGLLFGLVGGLFGGFTRVMVDKTFPNQGIKLSLKNSLAALLATSLTVGLIVGRVAGPMDGLTYGLMVGLIVGLNRGGSAVIKHYALRLTLWLSGYTPFKFVKFLDQCARLIFLKKVGGGYIFIHRMLLDYFADIPTQNTSVRR